MNKKIEEYHDFLAKNGISLTKDRNGVLFRSTTPYILDFLAGRDPSGVKCILEIGRSNGYSYGFLKYHFTNAMVVSIDIERTETAVKVSQLFDNNYVFIDGTSDELKNTDFEFDIAFIDGDHSYEWCKRDWDNAYPHLSKKAVVMFDDFDCVVNGERGVERFFNSLEGNKTVRYEHNDPMYGAFFVGEENDTIL